MMVCLNLRGTASSQRGQAFPPAYSRLGPGPHTPACPPRGAWLALAGHEGPPVAARLCCSGHSAAQQPRPCTQTRVIARSCLQSQPRHSRDSKDVSVCQHLPSGDDQVLPSSSCISHSHLCYHHAHNSTLDTLQRASQTDMTLYYGSE